jgi:methionyl-tRNA synthetase
MPQRYTITTPIYYVNSVPHIGTALTTLASDVTARYQKMRGREVFFVTGTDENGLKVLEAAQKEGKDPHAFVDEIAGAFQRIWPALYIEFDDFIRTTEPRHIEAVQEVWRRLEAKGHIYKGTYEGWYDVSSETFYKENELVDGKSPDGNEVRWLQEENYFFRLSAFAEPLLEHIEKNPRFIRPESRKNEVVSFIRQGLRDTSISRQNPGWGIPVPGDESKVVYVWFDALINYIAALGWPDGDWQSGWPAGVQWMGKDILTRFHATLWPAMLLGLEMPLPESLVGHGWMLMGGEKISKSKGNVVAPLDVARDLHERTGCSYEVAVDAVRYYMAAAMPFETDSVFTQEDFDKRYNVDLANDLGNALNRTLAMSHKFVEGRAPDGRAEPEARAAIEAAKAAFEAAMEEFRVDRAVDAVWGLVRFLNKYIDTRAPWALAKAQDPALTAVMRSMLLAIRSAGEMIRPVMPKTADAIASQLALGPVRGWDSIGAEETLPARSPLNLPHPIFPRLEKDPHAKPKPAQQPKPAAQPNPKEREGATPVDDGTVTIDEFMRIKFRVARIVEAEPVEGSDKLLKLQLMVGEERRQVVAGIRKDYDPMDLIGRQVVVVANLKPAKLRGVESQGMLLAATKDGGGAILLQPESEAPEGAEVR